MSDLGGYVTSYKMFIGRDNKIDEKGLLSQRIFGPVNNYKCICGKLSMSLDKGKLCKTCNVLCESSELRVKTFGKIDLVFPIIKLNKIKHIKDIFKSKINNILDPIYTDANASLKKYVAINTHGTKISIVDKISVSGQHVLPLRITGIYSFILILKYLVNNFYGQISIVDDIKKLFDNNVISYEIKVLPPEIRPVMIDPKKKNTIRITEVNKHYTSLLQLNKSNNMIKSNILIDEEHWMNLINVNFRKLIKEEIIEYGIMEYDKLNSKYQYYSNLVYNSVYDIISKKEGFIRSSILSRTIEFSARTVIRVNPAMEAYQISVSRKILFKLWKLQFIHYLTIIKEMDYDFCFENIISQDYEDVKDIFNDFLEWFCKST